MAQGTANRLIKVRIWVNSSIPYVEATRAISARDMKHNFVGSFKVDLPFDLLSTRDHRLTDGWSVAGTARFDTGLPGTLDNRVNNHLLDTPQYHGAPLDINESEKRTIRR